MINEQVFTQAFIERGYTDRDPATLTVEQLVEETLQSAYDSGYYSAADPHSDGHQSAITRRAACFAEITRRLAAAERLAVDMGRILSTLDTFPLVNNDNIAELVRELATESLTAWLEATNDDAD